MIHPREERSPRHPEAPASLEEFLASRVNPLLPAAVPPLALAAELYRPAGAFDLDLLLTRGATAIAEFEEIALQAEIPKHAIVVARWALCTTIDDAVFKMPGSEHGGWLCKNTLFHFHREPCGYERFFELLEHLLMNPQSNLALLEVWYLCLATGFQGSDRFRVDGPAALEHVRFDLYRRIEALRAEHFEFPRADPMANMLFNKGRAPRGRAAANPR